MIFVIFAVFALVAIILIAKKPSRTKTLPNGVELGFGIPMTKAETARENKYNDEILNQVEARLKASGYLYQEKIPELMSKLREETVAFGRNDVKNAYGEGVYLSVEEKRALGLNTRMKYSRTFIQYFKPESFKEIEPKSFLGTMRLDIFHRVSRKKELERLRETLGSTKVRLIPDFDCKKAKALRKTYSINDVPELPCPGCELEFCRCYFEAIIPSE